MATAGSTRHGGNFNTCNTCAARALGAAGQRRASSVIQFKRDVEARRAFRVKRYFFSKHPDRRPADWDRGIFFGWQVMKSEFRWIWLPAMVLIALGHVLKAGSSGL